MGKKDLDLIFSSDKPVSRDQLGTHQHIAHFLKKTLFSKSDNPLVIGLFGG
jgi:hypothetical protein